MSGSIKWPGTNANVPIYANLAAFPASAAVGTLGVAADSGIVYEWRGSSWVAVAGPGSVLSIGTYDSQAGVADGLQIVVDAIYAQSATATVPGMVNTGVQTLAGAKTFTGNITAANLSGTNTGDVTLGTANGLSLAAGQVLSLALSSTSTTGALSSTDWNTFNNKQAAGSYITALTGDVTATGPGSVAATLATVNSNVGSFTLSNITVNGKGLITAASSTTTGNLTDAGTDGIVITGGTGVVLGSGTSIAQHVADTTHNGYLSSTDWNTFNNKQSTLTLGNLTDVGTDGITVTGGIGAVVGSGTSISQHVADTTHNGYLSSTDWNTFNGKQAAGNYITALTGDVTASGPGSVAATLATVNANVGSFTIGSFTVNGKGLITAASSGTTGNLTDAGTDGITVTGGTGAVLGSGTSIAQHVSDSTHNGYLSSTDWSTFNSKQSALTFSTGLTNTGGTITVNTSQNISTLSNLTSNGFVKTTGGTGALSIDTSTYITGNQTITLSGDLTGSGTTAITGTLATVNSNVGSFTNANITVNGKGLVTAASNGSVANLTVTAAKTTTYTSSNSDDFIPVDASGGSFTVNLFTAVGNSGKVLRIKRIDQTLANAVTIDANGTQTIDGALTVALATQYEEYELTSDGANWYVSAHVVPSAFVSYTPTFTGFGTAASVEFAWKRIGDSIRILGKFASGTSTATEARISLPSGLTSGGSTPIPSIRACGTGGRSSNAANGNLVLIEQSVTYVTISTFNAASSISKQNGSSLLNAGETMSIYCDVPIAGWGG